MVLVRLKLLDLVLDRVLDRVLVLVLVKELDLVLVMVLELELEQELDKCNKTNHLQNNQQIRIAFQLHKLDGNCTLQSTKTKKIKNMNKKLKIDL